MLGRHVGGMNSGWPCLEPLAMAALCHGIVVDPFHGCDMLSASNLQWMFGHNQRS